MSAEPEIQPLTPTPQALQQLERIGRASFSEPWSLAEFDFLAADERSHQVGVWYNERLVGYAMALVEDLGCHLINLAVEGPYQRRGWGRRLVRSLTALASARGAHSCHLEVRASNEAALHLYSGLGFHQVAIRLRYYTRPTEDARIMECSLPLTAVEDIDLS